MPYALNVPFDLMARAERAGGAGRAGGERMTIRSAPVEPAVVRRPEP
ncbi:MAG: hypothetical protein QG608_2016 [Actinomycetota bacterium]|nr:hypothetical protein [Actinomycetota bacterium]